MENRQSAIRDLLSLGLPREGLGFDTRIHQIKTVKKPLSILPVNNKENRNQTHTSTTNLQIHNLPPYYRALLYQLSAFLPDSLNSYQHSHSPVAMEKIHITLAITALGTDTIKADTQPTYS